MCFRILDSVKESNNGLTIMFCFVLFWFFCIIYEQSSFIPLPWFVNTCVCTVLLWALDTGKETYIVFMRKKKKKKSVL